MDASILFKLVAAFLTCFNNLLGHFNPNDSNDSNNSNDFNNPNNPGKSYLGSYVSQSKFGIYRRAAVSTDSAPCAAVGRYIN